jgi:hypothetical protein
MAEGDDAKQPISRPADPNTVKPLTRDPDTSLSTRTMQRYETEDPVIEKKRSDASAMLTLWLLVIAVAALGAYVLTR